MKTLLFISLLVFAFGRAEATLVEWKGLTELVAESDHIIIATVSKVDMIDPSGKELTDPKARTGPDFGNTLRLHLRVKQDGVLKTNKRPHPETLIISLWQLWHDNLGKCKSQYEGKEMIFLLKGDNYTRVYPDGFDQPVSARGEIEQLIRETPSRRK